MVSFDEASFAMCGRYIAEVKWNIFKKNLTIIFGDNFSSLVLANVHFCSSRQSLLHKDEGAARENDIIYAVEMVADSKIVLQLEKRDGLFPSNVVMYDSQGRTSSDSNFLHPNHIYIVSSSGVIDVIFESWSLIL